MTYKRRLKDPLKGDFKQGIKGDFKDNNINMNNINKNNRQRTERKKDEPARFEKSSAILETYQKVYRSIDGKGNLQKRQEIPHS